MNDIIYDDVQHSVTFDRKSVIIFASNCVENSVYCNEVLLNFDPPLKEPHLVALGHILSQHENFSNIKEFLTCEEVKEYLNEGYVTSPSVLCLPCAWKHSVQLLRILFTGC